MIAALTIHVQQIYCQRISLFPRLEEKGILDEGLGVSA